MVELRRTGPLVVLSAILFFAARVGFADSEVFPPALSFNLEPGVAIPLGPGAEYFLPGASVRIGVEYTLAALPMLSLRANFLYGLSPIAAGLGTTSLAGGVVGASWRVPVVGRLSALAFTGAGYALGVINGDPASSASMLVGEAGIGLSWLVSPNAVLRLDGSYFYAFGANGSLAVSLGVLLRPWADAAQPVIDGRQRTGLQIEEVVLDTVYTSLGRFYDNHPVGKALVRNTGRRSVFDLKVSYRIPGVMERPRESAARTELKPNETWQAPLSMVLGSEGTEPGNPALKESEVAVTFVEGGEQWKLLRAARLDVQASPPGSTDRSLTSSVASTAGPAVRRLLVVFAPDPAESWSDLQRTSLADSLSLALRKATPRVMVIPHGAASFPDSPEERRKAAGKSGADCYIVVGMSGDRSSPVITAEIADLLVTPSARTGAGTRIGPAPVPDGSRAEWGRVVSMVVAAFVK